MQLTIGSRTFEVADFAEASSVYEAARSKSGQGMRRFPDGDIFDGGVKIARVSYNAKVWPPEDWFVGQQPLFDPHPARPEATMDNATREAGDPAAFPMKGSLADTKRRVLPLPLQAVCEMIDRELVREFPMALSDDTEMYRQGRRAGLLRVKTMLEDGALSA